MQTNFPEALAAVLKSEGGYVNSGYDPGGATNFGITQRVYDAVNDAKGRARQSVKFIRQEEVAAIYKLNYWDAVHGDVLAPGLDYVVFDYAVNSGPSRALRAYMTTPTIDGICDSRLAFLKGLPTWDHFGKGWATRVANVRALGKAMAATPIAAPQIAPTGPSPIPAPVTPPSPVTPPKPASTAPIGLLQALINIFIMLFSRKVKS